MGKIANANTRTGVIDTIEPSPKVTRLRATFFDTFSAKMGHSLGPLLMKNPSQSAL